MAGLSSKKKIIFNAAVLILVFLVFEITSFAFVNFYFHKSYSHFFSRDWDYYFGSVTEADLIRYRKGTYEVDLGWDFRPGFKGTSKNAAGEEWNYSVGNLGERANPYPAQKTLISSFGDSFTFGDEVENDETWQFYLSEMIQTNVLNFGVSGYGLDQAYLKMKKKLEEGLVTPIIILSLTPDSLMRLVTMNRGFSYPSDSHRLAFKPMLHNSGDGYSWIANPLRNLDSKEDVIQAVEIAKRYDFWYQARSLRNSFPYSFQVARLVFMFTGLTPSARQNQWENKMVIDKLDRIIDYFYDEVTKRNFMPVLNIIPSSGNFEQLVSGKRMDYEDFLEHLKTKYHGRKLIIVEVIREQFDRSRFNIMKYRGHASAY